MNQASYDTSGDSTLSRQPTLITHLLDSVVSEKRFQVANQQRVELEARLEDGFGLFALIDPVELSRVVSNLLNNALEAIEGDGKVTLGLKGTSDTISITLQDNGKGIPGHILERIREKRLTNGKEGSNSGSGLGLYHAKSTIEVAGGSLKVESQLGHGTRVTISLPRATTPVWFAERIEIPPKATVVSVDDDESIHHLWKERFTHSHLKQAAARLLCFDSTQKVESWLTNFQPEDVIFLVDYEFLGQTKSGLDFIENLGSGRKAVLVTSRFDEPKLRDRAKRLGIRILPKTLAPYVPISFC